MDGILLSVNGDIVSVQTKTGKKMNVDVTLPNNPQKQRGRKGEIRRLLAR